MLTSHFPLPFAGHRLHIVDFDASSFHEHDLLWLPHHDRLRSAGRKRKAEHLAGRIAAVHALREVGVRAVPDIGEKRQPLWPDGLFGSISHCASTALAVISRQRVGIDIEKIMSQHTATDLAPAIIDNDERQILKASSLPFPLALTLAFSAKESVYKAFSGNATLPGFDSAKITSLTATQISLNLLPAFAATTAERDVRIRWFQRDNRVITLCS
ncbi:enterobactin synthase subunit EntD [Salmonella enterica subsp. arizonae str. CFSAN000560]|uniref:Enterobactin synthase component D n=2 Tax=Salmonella enterica TaxID=28901 RepID=A0A2X4TI10_SALER|nr:enterobactin synthase subunit EntD [Salmonella enterica subsp. arizonae serovar 62:z36:-]ECG1411271.1 enterobactin synthase subunit EntD [Salmonella enterica subsp. arizonae str. CFSAN000560]ECG8550605.1 enterobactin synthase subunit EntD [Salmonella enterica subsp. arizonae]EIS6120669.1 enterobactin synthase subunit EntD [Salmonella enterica]KSB71257.1 phosphopantetheinyltransferase [Salmonella enterica subsp. arizonae serovar 62:z36:- str. 5335/86]QQP06893.1 enterobactin synthase subunit 